MPNNLDEFGLSTKTINPEWKKWSKYLKSDDNSDYINLIRLLVKKLDFMRQYYMTSDNSDRDNILTGLNKCYNLGFKILTNDYHTESDEFFMEYGKPHWLIDIINDELTIEESTWLAKLEYEDTNYQNDIKQFFKYIGDNIIDWWEE